MFTNELPRYRQIADLLRSQIATGQPAVGELMPTEIDLCTNYGVSRHTAREALRILTEDGLVERRQGHGTRVLKREPHRFQRSVSSIPDLLQYGASTRLDITTAKTIPATTQIAAWLQCSVATKCIHLHGVRSERQEKSPFCVSDIYRIATNDALTKRFVNARGAVYAIIDELASEHIGRVEQRMQATRLDATSAKELGLKADSPTLLIVRRYFDREGALILVAVNQHRPDDFVYTMDLTRNNS